MGILIFEEIEKIYIVMGVIYESFENKMKIM